MPLNNQGSLKKSKRKWRIKNVETDGYENKAIHNLWDTTKAVLRGKFIAVQSYLKKTRKTLTRQPNVILKTPGKRRGKKKLVEGEKS